MNINKFTNIETRFTILFLFLGIVGFVIVYYTFTLPEQQLIDKWKLDIKNTKIEIDKENQRLLTINCNDLKNAIANDEFVQLSDKAIKQYIGSCSK